MRDERVTRVRNYVVRVVDDETDEVVVEFKVRGRFAAPWAAGKRVADEFAFDTVVEVQEVAE